MTGLVPQAKESARNVWLAGMGALALAEQEGGRLFDRLVRMGAAYEARGRKRLGLMMDNVKDLGHDMGAVFDKAVAPVNHAMDSAMHRLGVPSRREIGTLSKRVEELTRVVERSRSRGRARAARH